MVLRFGSFLAGGLLLAALSACSNDSSDGADSSAGRAGSKPSGGAAGAAGQGGLSGGGAGQGGAAGSGAIAGTAGYGGAGRGGTGAAGAEAGLGGEGGDGASGGAGEAGSAGAGGEPGESRWQDCPSAEDYVGETTWPNLLEVAGDGIYCSTFNESRTLKEELAQKALLRIAPGSYRLPPAAAPSLGLPACMAYGEDGTGVPILPGSVAYTASELSGEVNHRYTFSAVAPSSDRQLSLGLDQATPTGESFHFTLDGRPNDLDSSNWEFFSFVLCQSLEEPCYPDRIFDSCTHETSALNRHELTLDAGTLVLDLRIGTSSASTEPGAFVRAAGTFRGQSFEQTNYFRLIYRPTHHHFERNFAVLFDAPIDGVCGLEVSNFSAFDEVAPSAHAIDCQLDRLETLSVSDFSLTREP